MLVHPQFNPIAIDLTKIGLPIAIHWYGITYLVAFGLFLWLASLRVRLPWFAERGWTRREIEDLLFYGVLGVVDRRAARLRAVLQARATTPPIRSRSSRSGRAACRSTAACSACSARWRSSGGAAVGRSSRSPTSSRRACRSAWPRDGSATSSTASCGVVRPIRACRGRWRSRNRARWCRAIRRRSTSSRSRACCCSCCCGCTRGASAGSARCRACSSSATASCASSPSTSASPMRSSACSRST